MAGVPLITGVSLTARVTRITPASVNESCALIALVTQIELVTLVEPVARIELDNRKTCAYDEE
jgi:hypothetical protein